MLANTRAKSLVALLQRVIEGLERQRAAVEAAAAARTSELDRVNQLLVDVPLVLSSTSFLPGGANAPEELKHVEDGELAGEEEDEDGEESGSSHAMDVDNSSESEGEVKPVARDPYGVIEVSSLLAERERPEPEMEEGNGGLGFQSIESDSTVTARSLLPPRIARKTKKQRKVAFDDEEEEEEKVVVQLF